MGHGHSHAPVTASGGQRRRLAVVLGLTVAVLVAEVVGAVAVRLARPARRRRAHGDRRGRASRWRSARSRLAQRPARGRRTFGWQRVEILAAVANGLLLARRRGVRARRGDPADRRPAGGRVRPDARHRGRRAGREPGLPRRAAPRAGAVAQRPRRLPGGARRRAGIGRGHRRRARHPRPPGGRRPTPSPPS